MSMNRYLRVQSGSMFFALPIEDVDRVYVPKNITPIPGAPACIRGAIAVADSIFVVADMRHLSCGIAAKIDVKSRVVCLANPVAGAMFSILVDRVLEIVSLDFEATSLVKANRHDGWYREVNDSGTKLCVTSAADIYAATNNSCIS